MFYSKTTGGFYDEAMHGTRKLFVIVHGWVHPKIEVPDPEWIVADHPEGTEVPQLSVPDPDAVPDMVDIDNPDCKIPADAVEISAAEHAALLAAQSAGQIIQADAGGKPIAADPPPPTPEQIEAELGARVQAHLDEAAKARGYDNIFTAVTYADEPAVARFQADGKALRAWRSKVWEMCYQVLAQVQAGKRPVPSAAELLAALPPAP